MAKQTTVRLIDDLDGGQADETVTFAFNGSAYEIDLSDTNAKQFRSLMEPFVTAARRVASAGSAAKPARRASNREQSQAVRAWARQQGIQIGDRGRIPVDVQLRFDAAHGQA